ncbi:Pycsar system effector family protein [Chloroflexota bacterium]
MSLDKVETVLKVLENENHLTERADQKSISMLSVLGVFMVFFIVYFRIIPVTAFTVSLIIIYSICAMFAILSLIVAINPRIRIEQGEKANGPPLCEPVFFTNICQFDSSSLYVKAMHDLVDDEETMISVFSRQIYSVARINSTKYRHLRRGMLLVVIALVTELALIAYLFVNYMGEGIMPDIR